MSTSLVVQRRLERGGEDVRVEDPRVRMVEDRGLDPAREERVRLAREELVERVVGGDEDREAAVAPARASPLLAKRRDRPREADRDRAVEQADVDAELERVRRGHAEELAFDEAPLDLASLLRGVAGAVRRKPLRCRGVDALGGEAVDQLGRLAALREADRAQTALDVSCERSRAASPSGLARRPSSASRSGGFQMTTSRSARADVSRSTTVAASPVSSSASSPGFAMVAVARRNWGSAS